MSTMLNVKITCRNGKLKNEISLSLIPEQDDIIIHVREAKEVEASGFQPEDSEFETRHALQGLVAQW